MKADDTKPSAEATRAQGYNGWTNYETWCVNLWLSNEPGVEDFITRLGKGSEDANELAMTIQSYLEGSNPYATEPTLYADLLNGALGKVNWNEVAQSFLDRG